MGRNIIKIKTNIIKMEQCRLSKSLSNFSVSKWIEVNDLLSGQYSVNKNITFKNLMLVSDLYDYSDGYIVVKQRITVEGDSDAKTSKKLIFKDHSRYISCVSKINNTFIDTVQKILILYNLILY